MAITGVSSASLLDNSSTTSYPNSPTGPNQSSPNNQGIRSSVASFSSSNAPDTLTQDMINLLKALAYGDVPGARNDLAKFKADLKVQAAATSSNTLAKDVTLLFKDLAAGNSAAAKTDAAGVHAALQAADSSTASTSSVPTASQLESLVAKISDALGSGAVQSAAHDLAGYLVQNGQATGSLLNTSF